MLAHTLVFGPTGAGKSTLLCTVALQALRYRGCHDLRLRQGPQHVGHGERLRRAAITTWRATASARLLPLAVLDSEADVAWAEDWIATCFELQTGRPPAPGEREAIHRAMVLLRDPGNERTLTHFVAQVQDETIRSALRYYTLEGTLGRLLDAEQDGLTEAHFTRLRDRGPDGDGRAEPDPGPALPVPPVRARRCKGQPAYLLLDEAWIMLGHPVFRAKIREWLKVMRKANCAVVLATQSLSDAARVRHPGRADRVPARPRSSCRTRRPTTAGTPEHPGPRDLYEAMGLNETQIEIIRSATKKRHYYLVSPEGRRLFDLGLGPIALSFAGISSKEQIAHLSRLAQREGETWPFAWLDEQGLDHEVPAVAAPPS